MHGEVVGSKVNYMRGLWSAPCQQEGAVVDAMGCVLGHSVMSGKLLRTFQFGVLVMALSWEGLPKSKHRHAAAPQTC